MTLPSIGAEKKARLTDPVVNGSLRFQGISDKQRAKRG